jgi:PST family polysaccharide transporter
MQEIAKKVKRGIRWQFITNILGQAIYLVNGVILARILNPRDFGIYGMALVLSNFIFMFWNLGLNAAIIQRKDVDKKHLDTAFTLSILMGITCFVIVWFAAPLLAMFFKEPVVSRIARIVGITFIIYALDRVPSALLNKNLHFKAIALTGLANPVIYGLVAIPLALLGFGPISFAWGIVLGAFGVMLGKIIWGLKLFPWRPNPMIDRKSAKHLLGFGVFIILSDILQYFFINFQRIIAGRFFGAIDLGYFTRASNLSILPLQKIQTNVRNVLLPAFSGIQDNREKIRNWFRKFNFFTYAIISPPIIFFIFFPGEFISGIFGEKWLPAAPLLIWMSASVMLSASYMYFQNIMKALGKPHLPFAINLGVFIPFVILLLVGAKHGILGVAIALFAATIIGFISNVSVLQFNKILSVKDIAISAIEPILISLGACLITFSVKSCVLNTQFISEVKLIVIASIFGIILLPYYIFRYFKRSYVNYLGFDIKKVIKI